MREQRTVVAGEDEFTLQQYPTTKALKYGISIGKIVGAMAAGGLDGMEDGEPASDIFDAMDAGGMVKGLMSQLDVDVTPELIKSMLQDAIAAYTVDGKIKTEWSDPWYETRFAGRIGDLVTILMAIFEDNFIQAVDVVKKKVGAVRPTTSPKSSASIPENGSGQPIAQYPLPEAESTSSFFDQ